MRRRLAPALTPRPDAVVLGCTHFPFLKDAIRAVAGQELCFFDGAEGTARETKRRLEDHGLLLPKTAGGQVTLKNSAAAPALTALEWQLLNEP